MLETKWCLLQEQLATSKASTNDLKPFFESYTSCLWAHLDWLGEQPQLDGELSMMQTFMEEYKRKRVKSRGLWCRSAGKLLVHVLKDLSL